MDADMKVSNAVDVSYTRHIPYTEKYMQQAKIAYISFQHVCGEIGVPSKSRTKIEGNGILTIDDLLKVKFRVEKGEMDAIKDEVKEKLIVAAEWFVRYPDEGIESFDEDVFEQFRSSISNGNDTDTTSDTIMDSEMMVSAD